MKPLRLVRMLALAATCCSRSPDTATRQPELACVAACETLTARACRRANASEREAASCSGSCTQAVALATASGCLHEHTRYLDCVLRRGSCSPPGTSAWLSLEQGLGQTSCRAEFEGYRSCTAPCREEGVVRIASARIPRSGRELQVAAELVGAGCALAAEPDRRAQPGSPCTHHSVCTAVRCTCGPRAAPYFARACVEQRCAVPAEACELASTAVGVELCPRSR